jgi:hypothetical protein
MGTIKAEIELINAVDLDNSESGILSPDKVRRLKVTALVDSGAYMMAINEKIMQQLGLKKRDTKSAQLATGELIDLKVVGPLFIKFENRTAMCNAMVLPGDAEVLLVAIPMEEMDVILLPKEQKMIVNPDTPYVAQLSLK